jgi:hypothetical protein
MSELYDRIVDSRIVLLLPLVLGWPHKEQKGAEGKIGFSGGNLELMQSGTDTDVRGVSFMNSQ